MRTLRRVRHDALQFRQICHELLLPARDYPAHDLSP
jgi:hypothetical protein